ncbi:MAG: metabolite traffic protein EboE [Planctomycetia bacterium]
MAYSSLPLGYCTNVHPCRTVADVVPLLDRFAVPIRDRCGFEIAVGLWLPATAAAEVAASPAAVASLREALVDRGLSCHTLNAFPHGDFHGMRVKESVYLPDWTDPRRLDYTLTCGRLLAAILPAGAEGSISTLPLGFKAAATRPTFESDAIASLLACGRGLAAIQSETGRLVRLAIEPEPFCLLETTAETVAFFGRLFAAAAAAGVEDLVRRHVGLCYDVCHQAVEFEDPAAAVAGLSAAGIRINKVQISCAIEVADPRDQAQREALATYVEPRYLHQTMARAADGSILRAVDLTADLVREPSPAWLAARPWRIHYHVPVDAERLGPLGTTRADLRAAIRAIGGLAEPPHLEVETYTWPVMTGGPQGVGAEDAGTPIVTGIANELRATRDLLAAPADRR